MPSTTKFIATYVMFSLAGSAFASEIGCSARSAERQTPVIELYTSEGCSSCPPADRWLSGLKGASAQGQVVAEAFHVSYWDQLGWVDRFATPAYTSRQKDIARQNGLEGIYTPQVVRNGLDWQGWPGPAQAPGTGQPAQVQIRLTRTQSTAQGEQFEAQVTPAPGAPAQWAAYWTVTEDAHSSRVRAGENAGAYLQHDFVVRQYTPAGNYEGPARLRFASLAAGATHPQRVNLVVYAPGSGRALQALSLQCDPAAPPLKSAARP